MSLNDKAIATGNAEYYTQGFRTTLESHIPYLLAEKVSAITVPTVLDVRYRNDFNGLMQALGIRSYLWWIVMRLNGLHSRYDYNGGLSNILVVSPDDIEDLMSTYISLR